MRRNLRPASQRQGGKAHQRYSEELSRLFPERLKFERAFRACRHCCIEALRPKSRGSPCWQLSTFRFLGCCCTESKPGYLYRQSHEGGTVRTAVTALPISLLMNSVTRATAQILPPRCPAQRRKTGLHRRHWFGAIEFVAAQNRVRPGRHEHLPDPGRTMRLILTL